MKNKPMIPIRGTTNVSKGRGVEVDCWKMVLHALTANMSIGQSVCRILIQI